MNHIGLFEGIGGFSLAARWMGWETIAWCEWNPFCQKVLKHHFPKAIPHGDITTTDFSVYRGQCNILTGGFPCQPYSVAGEQKGTEDERHLWPHMLRAVREIQPGYVVGENVSGLVSWNGGVVFDQVQADLEAEGYEVLPFLLPACGINAPHKRERIWFIAHAGSNGQQRRKQRLFQTHADRHDATGMLTGGIRRSEWANRLPKPRIFRDDDGLSERLAGITVSSWRNESIKSYGNAIVPQVAYEIFKAIQQYELQAPVLS
jgi:DNA (cytosine-5)-methyltransferase 1